MSAVRRLAWALACRAVDSFFWVFGVLLVIFAAVLIGLCVWVYYWTTLPYLFPAPSPGLVANFAVSVWLLANLVFNYATAVVSSAGEPPKAEAGKPIPHGHTVCRKCRAVRPPRAHHCSICNRCYYEFDHHCPWMHNCVGHNNRRYFVMTLVYLWVGCIYYASITAVPFYHIHYRGGFAPGAATAAFVTFSFIMAVAMIFAVGGLMCWHLYLVATAQTSIEFYLNRYTADEMRLEGQVFVNEYDLGVRWNLVNFFNVCERYPWWMVLLPVNVPAVGDGAKFVTVRDQLDIVKSIHELSSTNASKIV